MHHHGDLPECLQLLLPVKEVITRHLLQFQQEKLMIDERRQHLELVAASLTQSYYTVHTGGSPDHRDILETYLFLLDALVDHDAQKAGETPLSPGDTLAPFDADKPGVE